MQNEPNRGRRLVAAGWVVGLIVMAPQVVTISEVQIRANDVADASTRVVLPADPSPHYTTVARHYSGNRD